MNISNAHLRYLVTALAVAGTCFVFNRVGFCAEPDDAGDDQGAEVQTRGPVHEAFAGVVTFNPAPGVVVAKAPPEAIEEVPPDEKPDGDNVAWIPGYWAWDDERSDFLWVSGVWRALPPGRQWLPGYWAQSGKGYQWTSGYWADAQTSETAYLPAPPATIERGPNIEAPSPDYNWAPGCWVWYDSRYAWRPGYWMAGQADWDWCPAYYSYTPRGYVFVDGYWDYPVIRRGVLFAPVYFGAGVYGRRGFSYSPSIAIDLGVFPDHLFLRPSYHHYYFGDYYAVSYYRGGFYASFSFQSRRFGYDPIFSHERWKHRNDRGWAASVATTFKYRRDHVDARPPRTWAAERSITTAARSKNHSLAVATPFSELSKRKDSPARFQPVAKEERQQIAQRGQEVRKTGDDRRTLESKAVSAPNAKPGKNFQPSKAPLPKSAIVGQSTDQLGKDRSPPISPRQVARPDSKLTPKHDTTTPDSNANKNNRPSEPPKREIKDQAVPAQLERKPQAETPVRHEVKPEAQPPAKREAPPEVQPPVRREVKPEPASVKRETPAEVQKPVRRETPPEAKPEPQQRPAKEQPRENDKGEGRGEGKGERNKDEEQQSPPGR